LAGQSLELSKDKNVMVVNSFYVKPSKHNKYKDQLFLILKENGKKKIKVIDEPFIKYKISKQEKQLKKHKFYVPLDDCDEKTSRFKDLEKNIAKNLGSEYEDFIEDCIGSKSYNSMKQVHLNANVHDSDIDIEDYYMDLVANKYGLSKDKVQPGFFDIECDSMKIGEFPDENEAKAPVCMLSYFFEGVMTSFILLNYTKDEVRKYPKLKKLYKLKKDKEYRVKYKKKIRKRYKKDGMTKLNLKFYDDEFDLIEGFFNQVNEVDRPDVMLAWNAPFDVKTLLNRASKVKGVPKEEGNSYYGDFYKFSKTARNLIIPKDFRNKGIDFFYFKQDNRNQDLANRGSFFKCASYTQWGCQQQNFANLRKGKKQDSWSLDRTGELIVKQEKDELPEGVEMYQWLYLNPISFLDYNIQDVMLQVKIEKKVGDTQLIWNIGKVSSTRYEKALKKTVSLKNLARKFYRDKNYVISNNHNASYGGEGLNLYEHEKLFGAFCGDPNLIEENGWKFLGKLLSKYFRGVIDLDLRALYPSIIIAFNIEMGTQYGKLIWGKDDVIRKVNKRTKKIEEEKFFLDLAPYFIEKIIAEDFVQLGKFAYDLPELNDIIKEIEKDNEEAA